MLSYQDPNIPFEADRTRLPLHEPKYAPITAHYASEAPQPPPRFTPTAPEGAPNVLIVLIDDFGFGASSAFGGPIPMPTAERLAQKGIRFNRFHTTAICAPTRAALLSGYNHHSVNMGQVTEAGTAYPGNTSVRPKDVTPMARVLRENGYSTAQFGKCHETPTWETSVSGPFDHWPTFSGFDKFYGFLAAETDQHHPQLYDGVISIDTPDDPSYHLSEDLATKCIEWTRFQKALTPDKPFFTYFAPGATHSPHQAPKAYREMFKGKFDAGWDAMREETHRRMVEMGIIPKDAKLAPKPDAIKSWDELPEEEKSLYRLQMEIYAGYARHVDDQVGRVIDALEDMGILDDTVVFYILGDNGASPEGDFHGVYNEMATINGVEESFEFVNSKRDLLGTEMAHNHYSVGWAVALDAPFTWTKTIASNFGGTRNGMIVHYPKKFGDNTEVRSQFHHVIDVAPTVFELCGVPIPKEVDGVEQRPMEGVSMVYALADKKAEDKRKTQYFTIDIHHGIYHDGWFAGVIGNPPWERGNIAAYAKNEKWELYNIEKDYSCAVDLAETHPDKVKEMSDLFFAEAVKYNALPLEDRGLAIINASLVNRPTLMGDRKEVTLGNNMGALNEGSFLNTKNTSFEIIAEVEVEPDKHTDGVLFAFGGRPGGYALYVKDGVPTFCYNWVAHEYYYARSAKRLTDTRNQIKLHFQYDGGGLAKGGTMALYLNGEKVGEGRCEHTMGFNYGFDATANVGMQRGNPVTEEYTISGSKFQGAIYSVTVKLLD